MAAAGRRRTQAERSDETCAKLARAAFEIVAEKGHSAFRTAMVAARAGVSQGALVYHFPTKDDLTLAAFEYALGMADADSKSLLAAIPPGEDPVPHLLRDLRDFFLGPYYWVTLDIAMDGSKSAGLKDEIRRIAGLYRGGIYQTWIVALTQAGWAVADAEEIVRLASATMGGLGMRATWEDVTPHIPGAVARLRQIIMATWPPPPGFA